MSPQINRFLLIIGAIITISTILGESRELETNSFDTPLANYLEKRSLCNTFGGCGSDARSLVTNKGRGKQVLQRKILGMIRARHDHLPGYMPLKIQLGEDSADSNMGHYNRFMGDRRFSGRLARSN